MASPSKPSVLIIPASFSRPQMYNDLISSLKGLDLDVHIYPIPSASREPPEEAATLAEDAEYIQKVLNDLTGSGKDLVVFCHSYGGMVATESVKGFTADRPGKGRVMAIVYLTALVPTVGDSLMSLTKSNNAPEFDFLQFNGDFMSMDIEGSAKANFSDMPLEQGIEHAKEFHMHSLKSFMSEATYAGYEDVDHLAYIFCTRDVVLPPHVQEKMIENLSGGGKCQIHRFDLEAQHCAHANKPGEIAKIVADIVEKSSKA